MKNEASSLIVVTGACIVNLGWGKENKISRNHIMTSGHDASQIQWLRRWELQVIASKTCAIPNSKRWHGFVSWIWNFFPRSLKHTRSLSLLHNCLTHLGFALGIWWLPGLHGIGLFALHHLAACGTQHPLKTSHYAFKGFGDFLAFMGLAFIAFMLFITWPRVAHSTHWKLLTVQIQALRGLSTGGICSSSDLHKIKSNFARWRNGPKFCDQKLSPVLSHKRDLHGKRHGRKISFWTTKSKMAAACRCGHEGTTSKWENLGNTWKIPPNAFEICNTAKNCIIAIFTSRWSPPVDIFVIEKTIMSKQNFHERPGERLNNN